MLVCLFGILIAMSGCNASSIEGNWYENSNPDKNRIEFKDEGKAMFMANGYSDEITYSLSEDKKTVYLESLQIKSQAKNKKKIVLKNRHDKKTRGKRLV